MAILRKFLALMALWFIGNTALAYERIVVLSGDVSEILVALGESNHIIGKDDTNKTPELAHAKTVGMHRNLTAEPIIALKPDLVVGSYMVMPQSLYGRLMGLGIKAVNVAPDESVASYTKSIVTLGQLVDKNSQAQTLSDTWSKGMTPMPKTAKRYLLSYDGRIVAGKGTVGDELIRLAGGVNAANVSGLKPLSREGWLAAKPDVIIIAAHHQATLGSVDAFIVRPEIKNTPAATHKNVHYWPANDFLRYGLDSPKVLKKLHRLAK